jgi:hypothetical protein
MKNLSTGTGLALLSAGILGSTIIMRFGPADQAAHAAPPMEAAKAIAAASTVQVTPTIVWYQAVARYGGYGYWIIRSWSDGKIESRWCNTNNSTLENCNGLGNPPCFGNWVVVSDPNMGFNAASDSNFDSKVDGSDLGQLLASWGDAPRQDIPPSDCPLNLINP